jgi:hypothetical protein
MDRHQPIVIVILFDDIDKHRLLRGRGQAAPGNGLWGLRKIDRAEAPETKKAGAAYL